MIAALLQVGGGAAAAAAAAGENIVAFAHSKS
jgi:hypothetical protein